MIEGFSAATVGGRDGEIVTVTSLADSGEGTLREALSGSNRRIVFAVHGTIALESQLEMRGRHAVTIDGSTAPPPGITLYGYGLTLRAVQDVVVTHLRIRAASGDNLLVWRESRRVVVDHCSLTDTGDECLNITEDTTDVTVSWCLMGDTRVQGPVKAKGCLITNWDRPPVTRVSMHHNLFYNLHDRSPQISTAGLHDFRCNVIHDWTSYGSRWRNDAFGNIVNNVFASHSRPWDALVITEDAGRVYVAGNLGPESLGVDWLSTRDEPYSVPDVTTEPVESVERLVHAMCGAQPRDKLDTMIIEASALGRQVL